jgi:hypothetical protein
MMCFQLFVTGDQLVALNMHSAHGPPSTASARTSATPPWRWQMDSRDVIGQAKGD